MSLCKRLRNGFRRYFARSRTGHMIKTFTLGEFKIRNSRLKQYNRIAVLQLTPLHSPWFTKTKAFVFLACRNEKLSGIAGLQVTSRRPCSWSVRVKNNLKHLSPLGTKLYFHVNSSRKSSIVLTTNITSFSRGCKPRIVSTWPHTLISCIRRIRNSSCFLMFSGTTIIYSLSNLRCRITSDEYWKKKCHILISNPFLNLSNKTETFLIYF